MKRMTCYLCAVVALVGHGYADDSPDAVETSATVIARQAYEGVTHDTIRELPIGLFDSGTGGLTVLEAILTMDAFKNGSLSPGQGGDGKSDFDRESFIFLADQANMPYGNYPVVGKHDLLDDLIVKDAAFLMGSECSCREGAAWVTTGKQPVKAIVIACNTATAYGQPDIERVIRAAGLDIRVVGVIESGARGAVEVFEDGNPGSIGVVPTMGTVLSNAYPQAIRRIARERNLTQRIEIVQQGAIGLAGAIDGAREFILPDAETAALRAGYRGPSVDHAEACVDCEILARYDFDFSRQQMLYSGTPDNPTAIQINSVENYVAYHLVSLLEQMRQKDNAPPFRALVLGCTHFPFFRDAFRAELRRLREYQENGEFIYRALIADSVELIDPAWFTARELYKGLVDSELFRESDVERPGARGEFYVTIPCREQPGLQLDHRGWFAYDYKYGRDAGSTASSFRAVPLDGSNLSPAVFERLQRRVPTVWALMQSGQAR